MLLLSFILAALAMFVISIDVSWSNVLSTSRNDLVFENRNKEYGAFFQRKEYHTNLMWALFISIGLVVGGVFAIQTASASPHFLPPTPSETYVIPYDITPIEEEKQEEEADPVESEHPEEPLDSGQPTEALDNAEIEVIEDDRIQDPILTHDQMVNKPLGGQSTQVNGGGVEPREDGQGGDDESGKDHKIHEFAEVLPEFPGGNQALYLYMSKVIMYPEDARETNTQGTVTVSFVVEADGSVSQVKVERGIIGGKSLDKEAVRAVKQMPKWSPGRMNDRPVAVKMRIPVKFQLNQ